MEVWIDFASPYSYLAVERITTPVVWKPFLLGPIFADRGWTDSPFVLFPDKARHMWRDVEREAAHYKIPFTKPTRFPAKSSLAARIATVLDDVQPFARAVYKAHFVDDLDIGDPAVLDAILGDEGPAIRARALASKQLRANIEQARALGIFGAPMFRVGDELFWGNDRLERALEHAR
jgi:2-hydroxychromene-2-carboxylate isomerase